jgi:hypothetical protein
MQFFLFIRLASWERSLMVQFLYMPFSTDACLFRTLDHLPAAAFATCLDWLVTFS